MSRPKRLPGVSYVGPHQYFLTICTHRRSRLFEEETFVSDVLHQFRRTSVVEGFALLVYCFMPDHAHLLVEGLTDTSDLRRFVKLAKQRSGAIYAATHRRRLWQEGYYERMLRRDDDVKGIARYILENPVRAGLVTCPREYPFLGSDVWSLSRTDRRQWPMSRWGLLDVGRVFWTLR
jgi:putative transposase